MTSKSGPEKKTAAPVQRDGQTSTTWKGSKMQHQINSDELLVAIKGLCEFYNCPETAPMLTSSPSGSWLANLAVTRQFRGKDVFAGPANTLLFARGATLRQALEGLHDAFIAAAPSFEMLKGA